MRAVLLTPQPLDAISGNNATARRLARSLGDRGVEVRVASTAGGDEDRLLEELRAFRPDILHCHDWQTGLLPVLLRTSYRDDPVVKDLPVVFTIHNMGYHGLFRRAAMASAGIPEVVFNPGIDSLG